MSQLTPNDRRWLDAATRLATPYLGTTSDNPTVGALLVSAQGILIGQAVTAKGGRPHAETQAIARAEHATKGATLYVTLEPCNHWGRTPPCCDAVIRAGIARVVIGQVDPDPRTAGQGIERLRRAGIEVLVAGDRGTARLHEGHVMRKTKRRPFVTVKLAVSADGRIGLKDKGNAPISGDIAQRWTHMQRALSDAVMVGASTAAIDNPRLTVRLKGLEKRTPLRIVLAGGKPFPPGIGILEDLQVFPVAVILASDSEIRLPSSVEQIRVDGTNRRPHLFSALRALGERGIQHLFVEAGARLAEGLLTADLVDRFELIEGTTTIGPDGIKATTVRASMPERLLAAGFAEVDQRALGDDMLTTFERVS